MRLRGGGLPVGRMAAWVDEWITATRFVPMMFSTCDMVMR